MAIFERRSKKKTAGPVGVTAISLKTPGILAGTGYHLLTDAPEVDAAIRKIANLVASMPIHLLENRSNGDVRISDQLARKIDVNPWSLGTRQTFICWIVSTMITEGDAVVIPKTAGPLIADLLPAPGATLHKDYGSPSYYAMYDGKRFEADDILHFRLRPDLSSPWRGEGLRVQLAPIVDSILQTAETKTAYMSSEYKPPLIVAVGSDSPLDDTDEREKFAKTYLDRTDKRMPWILPADMVSVSQAKPLSLTDLAIKDGVELDKKTVAAILGIPPFLLGVGSFSKEEFNNFVNTEIRIYGEIIQQELTKKLLLSDTRYFRCNPRALYSYSLQELGSEARANRAAGLMTGNEARNWMNLPPKSGLDELVMLENYIPANLLGNQKKLNGGTTPKEDEPNA